MTTTPSPTNTDDIIDSRDIITRIGDIEGEIETITSDKGAALDELDDLRDELEILKSLADEAKGSPDGGALIRYSHFKTYAQDLAEQLFAADSNDRWPQNCIDWDKAALELQQDYFTVSFDGIDYWIRS